ncbi:MAG: hypothetical protein IJM93_02415 [Oscillospiraceae bacterium]|nr:hypothetical protein [Oscillospiraceae bacterium]
MENLKTILIALAASVVLGLIIGRAVANFKYPDPNKHHVFTPKQSLIATAVVLVSVGLILFGLLYKPQPKTPDEGMFGEGEGYTEEGGFAGDAAVAIG